MDTVVVMVGVGMREVVMIYVGGSIEGGVRRLRRFCGLSCVLPITYGVRRILCLVGQDVVLSLEVHVEIST
jgi:hypothetical protein